MPKKEKEPIHPRQATYHRLLDKFRTVSDALAHALLEIADEILATREACAKVMCPLCEAGDPRVTVNGKEMHTCSFLRYEKTDMDRGRIQLPCKANPIWSME